MIFQFQTGDVTFFDEDREYFEKRLLSVKKFLGDWAGDEDTVNVTIKINKNKHSSGDRFEAKCSMDCPHLGVVHADEEGENIKMLADLLHDNLKTQIKRSRDKALGK